MRIDAAVPLPESLQTQKVTRSGSSSQQSSAAAISSNQDRTQLSGDSTTVQQLKASLAQVPEVRQQRVAALRQAVGNGSYQVSDEQLSDAIGSNLLAGQFRLT
jgi:negative regulator of flagellin synthesis FlgM